MRIKPGESAAAPASAGNTVAVNYRLGDVVRVLPRALKRLTKDGVNTPEELAKLRVVAAKTDEVGRRLLRLVPQGATMSIGWVAVEDLERVG